MVFWKVLGPKIVGLLLLCLLLRLWSYNRNAELYLWIFRVLLTIFGGMVCYSILVALVFTVTLLLYFSLICLTDFYMWWPMHRNLHNIQYKLGCHRVQFGHLCFSTYTYVRQLPLQVRHCHLVSYCDDSTLLKVIPSWEARTLAEEEINFDLNAVVCWGKR